MKSASLRQTGVSFFLGAGASMDLGFPSGHQLKLDIARDLDSESRSPLRQTAEGLFPGDLILDFTRELCRAENATKSIDAIAEANRRFCELARTAVWWTILRYEQACDLGKIEGYWFYRFLSRYYAGCRRAQDLWDIGDHTLSLVVNTLNYDRLIDKTFQIWLARNIPDSNEDIETKVLHKHGSLQKLSVLPFGAPFPKIDDVGESAKHLRFWFEKSPQPEEWSLTNIPIQLRETLAIVGFGYHEDIVSRFELSPLREVILRRVVATAAHVRDPERRLGIMGALRAKFGTHAEIDLLSASCGCAEAIERLFD